MSIELLVERCSATRGGPENDSTFDSLKHACCVEILVSLCWGPPCDGARVCVSAGMQART